MEDFLTFFFSTAGKEDARNISLYFYPPCQTLLRFQMRRTNHPGRHSTRYAVLCCQARIFFAPGLCKIRCFPNKVFARGFQCARTPITYAVGSFSFLHVFTYLSPNPLCSWCIRSLMLLVHFLSYMCLFAVSKSSVQLVYSIDDHASQEYFPLELSNADYAARILRIAGHVLREVKSYL